MIRHFSLTLLVLVTTNVHSLAGPNEFLARFRDDSVIRRAVLQGPIEVDTRFGRLSVPIKEVSSIEFGLRIPDAVAGQVELELKRLGSGNFKEREQASHNLVKHGIYAYAALQRAARSKDQEIAKRARAALETIRLEVPAKRLQVKPEDTVYSGDSVIVGKIAAASLRARTANFGELTFQVHDLRSIHNMAGAVEKTLELDFGKHSLRWFDTGIDCDPRFGLKITVSRGGSLSAYIGNNPEQGAPIPVWTNLVGRPKSKGRLYLRITGNGRAQGVYKVKVSLLPGFEGKDITSAVIDPARSTPADFGLPALPPPVNPPDPANPIPPPPTPSGAPG